MKLVVLISYGLLGLAHLVQAQEGMAINATAELPENTELNHYTSPAMALQLAENCKLWESDKIRTPSPNERAIVDRLILTYQTGIEYRNDRPIAITQRAYDADWDWATNSGNTYGTVRSPFTEVYLSREANQRLADVVKRALTVAKSAPKDGCAQSFWVYSRYQSIGAEAYYSLKKAFLRTDVKKFVFAPGGESTALDEDVKNLLESCKQDKTGFPGLAPDTNFGGYVEDQLQLAKHSTSPLNQDILSDLYRQVGFRMLNDGHPKKCEEIAKIESNFFADLDRAGQEIGAHIVTAWK